MPSKVTAECCHQRWFLSNRQMQGMLVIAEAEVGNCVRWLQRKGLSVLFKAGFSVLVKCKTSLLSRNNWRIAREVPSQVTTECCHQRWFLSAQRVQGMLFIAEATDVKRVRGRVVLQTRKLALGSKRRLTLQEEAAKPSVDFKEKNKKNTSWKGGHYVPRCSSVR